MSQPDRWRNVAGGLLLSCCALGGAYAQPQPIRVFPLVADGQGVRAELALTNPGGESDSGAIRFWADDGQPLGLSIGGENRSAVPYNLPPGGAFKISTDGRGAFKSGYATVISENEGSSISGTIIYSINGSQLSVPASPLSAEYHVFAERGPGANSGLAFANPSSETAQLYLSLHDSSGAPRAEREVRLGPRAKQARFIDEFFSGFFEDHPEEFEGTVQAVSNRPFAMIGMRQRDDGSLATLSGAPTAFFSGAAQLLLALDTGVDAGGSGLSDEELSQGSVFEVLGVDSAANQQFAHLENTSSENALAVTARYLNDRCQEILSFLIVLDCGEALVFDPFDFRIPMTGFNVRQRIFGIPPDLDPITARQFGSGRFALVVSAAGAAREGGDEADLLLPNELEAGLSCHPPREAIGMEGGPGDENLHICNARVRTANILSGFLSTDDRSECRGPFTRAGPAVLAASEFTRALSPDPDLTGIACLRPVPPASCALLPVLESFGSAACDDNTAGATLGVRIPGRPNDLLPPGR